VSQDEGDGTTNSFGNTDLEFVRQPLKLWAYFRIDIAGLGDNVSVVAVL